MSKRWSTTGIPDYMRDMLLFQLTVEARSEYRVQAYPNGKSFDAWAHRRRSSTGSIDQTNYAKTVDSMLTLLRILDCEIDVLVRDRTA